MGLLITVVMELEDINVLLEMTIRLILVNIPITNIDVIKRQLFVARLIKGVTV